MSRGSAAGPSIPPPLVAPERGGGSAARLARLAAAPPPWAWALMLYTATSLATIGRFALLHPASVCACVGTQDPAAYMWGLSWWPHALAHGLNPFVTHYQWAPTGVNVARAAMIPTAALAMTPVTELAGPLAAYNVLTVLGPVLAAFTAYRLCRRIAGRELPAVAGGYLFGFSTYELAQSQGHLNLTLIFLLPLMVHVSLRRASDELSRTRFVIAMAVMLVAQAGLSTELLAVSVAFGALALLAAWVFGSQRRTVERLALEVVAAGGIALVLASPLLYYALFSGSFPHGASTLSDAYGMDALNPVFPTYATRIGRNYFLALGNTFTSHNVTEAGGYLSFALVAAFLLWGVREGHSKPLGRVVLTVAAVSFVVALGSHLHVASVQTMPLPYQLIRHAPVADNIVPARIFLVTDLAVAIGLAVWLARPSPGSWARWALVLAGVVLILPNVIRPLYGTAPNRPRFFATGLYRRYIEQGSTVLVLPFGQNDISTLWQAESGYRFYMPEGYVSGEIPPPFSTEAAIGEMLSGIPPAPAVLRDFIVSHRVDWVIVDPRLAGPWPAALHGLGLHGRTVGGLMLYRVGAAS